MCSSSVFSAVRVRVWMRFVNWNSRWIERQIDVMKNLWIFRVGTISGCDVRVGCPCIQSETDYETL